MKFARKWTIAVALFLAAMLSAGCGYHLSGNPDNEPGYQWHTLYRDDVKTVAVPIFGNRTYVQGAEFKLTKAVIGQIEGQTPYKVVPKERADTILDCEIVNTRTITLSNNRTSAVPMEQMFVFVVRFTWRDLRTGKILIKREGFEQTSPYYPTLGEDQWVGQQENIERLALAIVQEMQADWGTKDTRAPTPQ
ncbi:MAG TPA: LPS assembly lipoprotein LptE [Tepidisphaeraceae bacterium]|nr:LPS assembly lipoprotein LptE [Tepidisphaeraceae bacterium]